MMMSNWKKRLFNHQALHWVLMISLSIQLMGQLHLHEHHVTSPVHDHVVDYHMVADDHNDGHFEHANTHEINSSALVIVKKLFDTNSYSIFYACLLLLLFSVNPGVIRWKPVYSHVSSINQYYALSPPLRAPPVI